MMKRNKMNIGLLIVTLFTSTSFFGQNQQKEDKTKKELTIEEVFELRDKNEDGKLAKSELIGFVSNDFEKLDTDKDGFLSKDELAKSSKFQKKRNRPNNQRGERPSIAELFTEMDSNNDGKLSKKEAKGPLADDFSKIDCNSDGFLTKEELEKAPKPNERQQGQRPPRN